MVRFITKFAIINVAIMIVIFMVESIFGSSEMEPNPYRLSQTEIFLGLLYTKFYFFVVLVLMNMIALKVRSIFRRINHVLLYLLVGGLLEGAYWLAKEWIGSTGTWHVVPLTFPFAILLQTLMFGLIYYVWVERS